MRIIGLETVQIEEFSNLVWVRLHTDEGLVGLGETFRNPGAVVAYVHETCASYLLGQDPMNRVMLYEGLRHEVGNHFQGFPTRSVELRGNSAVDIALWDLWGQALGQPISALLGGTVQEKVRIYNTCANSGYNNKARTGNNSQLCSRSDPAPKSISRNEDLLMQVFEPARLARELLDEGINAMKIWPFDVCALRNRGQRISPIELKEALWPLEQIRDEVGDAMEIMIEYHGLWQLPAAIEIARAVEDFDVFWHEDPVGPEHFEDLAAFHDATSSRLAGSESHGTLAWYREMFGRGAIDVANFDTAWIGGLTEAQRITHMAMAYNRSIAPHDCTGPVTLLANLQLMSASPNALIAETVRAHLDGFYRAVMTDIPEVENGYIFPVKGPGLGAALNAEVLARGDLVRTVTGQTAD